MNSYEGWYDESYQAGLDLPPWWTVVPGLGPLGLAQWGGGMFHQRPLPATSSLPFSTGTTPSSVPWLGIAAIVGIGAVLIYGISRVSKSSERFVGPIEKRAGKFAARMARSQAGGSTKSFDNSPRSVLASRIVEAKFLPAQV